MKQHFLVGLLVLPFLAVSASAQPVGIFENLSDIGEPGISGLANFENDVYTLEAGGGGIGYRRLDDQFFFVNTEMSGNFAIEGYPFPSGTAGWGGLMVRDTLDADSPHASIMIATTGRGTNSTTGSFHPFFRSSKGGGTMTDGDYEPGGWSDGHVGNVRLERLGNTFNFYSKDNAGQWILRRTEIVPMSDPVYVGLAATADDNNNLTFYDFSEVAIEEYAATVERNLPVDDLQPGATLNPVTLTVTVRDGQTADVSITEIPPKGGTISNFTASAGTATQDANGSIRWNLTGATGTATLTYTLQLGNRPTATFHGTFSLGSRTGNFIGGDAILPTIPAFQPLENPAPIDPDFPTVIQAEQGVAYTENDWHLMVFPQLDNGIVAMSASTTAGDVLEYAFTVPAAGTYYIFGLVRGNDGNSDSFHFGMDALPEGNDNSRWNISGNRVFQHDYVSSAGLGQDPMPFDLTAGEHFFYLGNREDDAAIDYLVVTTNPSLDLANIDLDAPGFFGRTIADGIAEPGESIAVEVSASIRDGISDTITIRETPPVGFTVSNIQPSGGTTTTEADGSIVWNVTGLGGQNVTLQYQLTPAAVTGNAGVYGVVTGTVKVGAEEPSPLGGDTIVGVFGNPGTPSGKTAYFFMDVPRNYLVDQFIQADLQNVFGLELTLIDDGDEPGFERPADTSGVDAVFVSESVGSGNIAGMDYQLNSPEPIFSWEALMGDEYAFQPGVGSGAVDGTDIEIVNNTHPITQGFNLGVIQVYSIPLQLGYLDNPPAGITVLATEPGNPNRAFLWTIEQNATVNGTTSPGLRVMTFLQLNGYAALTLPGRRLINQAIAYTLGVQPPDTAIEDFMLY